MLSPLLHPRSLRVVIVKCSKTFGNQLFKNHLPLLTFYLTVNEAEYLMKNYGDRGECYRPRWITPSEMFFVYAVFAMFLAIISPSSSRSSYS